MSTYDERYYNACPDSMSNASYSNTTQGDVAMIIYEPKNKYQWINTYTFHVSPSHTTPLNAMGKCHGKFRIGDQTDMVLVRISISNSFLGMLGDRYFIDSICFWSGYYCGWSKIGFFSGWQRCHGGWERR